jgi:ABC-type glutathione transport system ATPase component
MSVPVPLKAASAKAGVMAMDVDLTEGHEDEGMVGGGVKVAKEKVKEMVMSGGGGWEVVGISGMGGSGKTTLAMEIFKDHKVRGKENRDQILTIFSFNPFQIVCKGRVFLRNRPVLRAKIPSFHELLGAKFSKLGGMASSVVGLRACRAVR